MRTNPFRPINIIRVLFIFSIAACSSSAPPEYEAGWEKATPIHTARSAAKAVIVDQHLYVIGGVKKPIPETTLASVEFTRIKPDGSLDPWENTSPLNTPRMFLATAKANGVIYAIGGQYFPEGKRTLLNRVERAVIGPDGRLGPWIESSPMLTPRRSPTATIVDGYLYAIGGYNGIFLRTIERAHILEGGAIGPWKYLPQPMPTARYIHGGATKDGRIYVVGGHVQGSGSGDNTAEWAKVGPDGQLGPWNTASSLHQPRFLAGSTSTDHFIFVVGGYEGKYLSSVERVRISPDGNLGPWTEAVPLPKPREGAAVAAAKDHIYVIGGSRDGDYLPTVEHAKILEDGRLVRLKKK